MLVVGLTGSIGMGKSTAAARFREHGIEVFDADAEVHRLYAGPLAPDIERAFPGSLTDGKVDRPKLSARLVAEPQGFKRLESIVHPRIQRANAAFFRPSTHVAPPWPCSKCRCCSRPAAIVPSMSGSSLAPRATSSADASFNGQE